MESRIETAVSRSESVLRPLEKVARRHDRASLVERLIEVRAFLASDLANVETTMQNFGSQTHPAAKKVTQAAGHLLQLPGKRIRSLCVLLSARLFGHVIDDNVRNLATACELVHAATLLHDDVIDDSNERRGAAAARILYGNSVSILAGDYLLIEGLRLVQQTQQPALSEGLLNVISQMVFAEALQLERRGRFEPSREAYLHVIRGKTAALFDWGLAAGARAHDLQEHEKLALQQVGLSLGMAFQLVDDILDLDGSPEALGKEVLVDLREGKLTWPLIIAAEESPKLRERLSEISAKQEPIHVEQAYSILAAIRQTNALQATRAFALEHAAMAFDALQKLPNNTAREALRCVVESAVHRAQ
jgi:octaprenyl-diphosphate synthase